MKKKIQRSNEKDSALSLPSIPEQSHVTNTFTNANHDDDDDDDDVKSLTNDMMKSLSLKQDDENDETKYNHSTKEEEEEEDDDEQKKERSEFNNKSSRSSGPILVTEQDWELTWPIWHLLPIAERRKIAHDHGGMSIGEFEEYMTLSKALHLNNDTNTTHNSNLTSQQMYDNTILYQQEQRPEYYGLPTVAQNNKPLNTHPHQNNNNNTDHHHHHHHHDNDQLEDNEEDVHSIHNNDISSTSSSISSTQENRIEEEEEEDNPQRLVERGGYMALLPQEIQDSIMMFLNVDYYAQCALVCKVWHNFTRTEPHVYKLICQRVYLQQSKRKALHVSRFQNSYRNMLLQRPRVKMGTGLYVLKYSQIKKIQRDMWTEVPVGAILESVYYRYLYFHEHSRVLYALTSAPPYEMIARFLKMKCTGEPDKSAVWATYQVQKYQITVTASHPWLDVQMHLSIPHNTTTTSSNNNKARIQNYCFDTLTIDKHMSSRSGDFDEYYSQDLVYYDVPSEPFRFLRDWRL